MTKSEHHTQHPEPDRDAILDAARTILVQRDYGRFSMRGVAAEAGCSSGTIYLHFKSEQLLLNCIVDEVFDALLETLEQIDNMDDPIQSLIKKLHAYVDFGLQFPHHYRVAFIQRPPGRAVTVEGKPHACYDVLRDSVRSCIDQKFFASLDVETASQVLWSVIHGVTSALIVMPKFPWVDRELLIDTVIDTAIEGLRKTSENGLDRVDSNTARVASQKHRGPIRLK